METAYRTLTAPDEDGRDELLALVVAQNPDGTVDVVTFPGGNRLNSLPVYDSRAELETALAEYFPNIRDAQGIAHPLKDPEVPGKRREPTVHDVIPWHNGCYPLASAGAGDELAELRERLAASERDLADLRERHEQGLATLRTQLAEVTAVPEQGSGTELQGA